MRFRDSFRDGFRHARGDPGDFTGAGKFISGKIGTTHHQLKADAECYAPDVSVTEGFAQIRAMLRRDR